MDAIKSAKQVLRIEAEAILNLTNRINKNFARAVEIIYNCKGMLVITGMGKAGIIAQKISATLSSTGTPSLWLHPAEAIHGDLGRVKKDDVVIALSNSGETEELTRLLPVIKKMGAVLIAMTGNIKSTLARHSDVVLDVGIEEEACPLGLAPTASTTAMLAIGDALAIAVSDRKGFKEKDFALLHPGGNLGRRLLLTVGDIMRTSEANPVVFENMTVKEVLLTITKARAGSASVVNKRGILVGIFTDGDLRRHLEVEPDLSKRRVGEVMTRKPITITKDKMAVEALKILQERRIDELPVVDERSRPIGLLDVQDLLKAGLV